MGNLTTLIQNYRYKLCVLYRPSLRLNHDNNIDVSNGYTPFYCQDLTICIFKFIMGITTC